MEDRCPLQAVPLGRAGKPSSSQFPGAQEGGGVPLEGDRQDQSRQHISSSRRLAQGACSLHSPGRQHPIPGVGVTDPRTPDPCTDQCHGSVTGPCTGGLVDEFKEQEHEIHGPGCGSGRHPRGPETRLAQRGQGWGRGWCSGACAQGRGGPASHGGSRPSCPSRLPPPHPGEVTGEVETPEQ